MDTSVFVQKERTTDQNDRRWQAVVARDAEADGSFVYAVRTTGVYCRPSCSARVPLRANVVFHQTCADAEAAGFRPCLRCRPNEMSLDERRAAAVTQACRLIEAAESAPSLTALSTAAGMSTYHFHRVFKKVTGVTPKAYAAQYRATRAVAALQEGRTITHAFYDAGFNASSRFYESSTARLGMTPTAFRAGGSGVCVNFAIGECTLGSILVATTDKGVCAILLGPEPDALARKLQDLFPQAEMRAGDPMFEELVATVVGFVEDPSRRFELPLDVRGTAFQQRVWQELQKIPFGVTSTYAEIAKAIGRPTAHRAVAAACAANKIAVAIPCHRVIRSDGSASGYRWGIDRKHALIAREQSMRRRHDRTS